MPQAADDAVHCTCSCEGTRCISELAATTPTTLAECDWQPVDVTGTQVM